MTEAVAWTANVLFLLGAWLLAYKRAGGFVAQAAANALYCLIAVSFDCFALVCLSAALAAINVYGLVMWCKE